MNVRPVRTGAALVAALLLLVAAGSAQVFTPSDEAPEDFPPGQGREETFATCIGCHNFKLVAAQGQTRQQWEDSIDLMISKHKMPALEPNERALILDYLEAAFPPRARPGGQRNPFLDR